MPTFIALLRGVNVGKARRVAMADFRNLLSGLGHTDIATLLNSGNAVFRSARSSPARLAADLAAAFVAELKLEVPVIVKSATELEAIVSGCPIRPEAPDHSRFLVAFVQGPGELATLAPIAPLVVPPERFAIGGQAAYLLCARGMLESKAATALLGKAGRSATTRNWATVLKLQALAGERA